MDVKNEKMLIVDGSSLISACYYGTLPKGILFAKTEEEKEKLYPQLMNNGRGMYTNGLYGFYRTMAGLLKAQGITHLAVCLDHSRENLYRKQVFPEYKGNRKTTPPPLRQQFENLEKILKKIGVPVFVNDTDEADDFAASITKALKGTIPIRAYSKDQDWLQLVDGANDVLVWLMQTKQESCDQAQAQFGLGNPWPKKVIEYYDYAVYLNYGVWPSQIPDLKGLAGDSADNIPGVKGIASAAVPLLKKYGTIKNIYEDIHSCDGDSKALKALKERWKAELPCQNPFEKMVKEYEPNAWFKNAEQAATTSQVLATMQSNIPVPTDKEAYRLNINMQALQECLAYLAIQPIH